MINIFASRGWGRFGRLLYEEMWKARAEKSEAVVLMHI